MCAAVVRGSLRRGGAGARPRSGSGRQVPTTTKVSAADGHLGRRADRLLLQGALAARAQGLLRRQALPDVRRQATAVAADRAHADADWQLVQEPTPEGSLVATATAWSTTLRHVA